MRNEKAVKYICQEICYLPDISVTRNSTQEVFAARLSFGRCRIVKRNMQGGFVVQDGAHMCRVDQNRIYTPYMTVYLMISLPKVPYIHRIYMVLANPTYVRNCAKSHRTDPCYSYNT